MLSTWRRWRAIRHLYYTGHFQMRNTLSGFFMHTGTWYYWTWTTLFDVDSISCRGDVGFSHHWLYSPTQSLSLLVIVWRFTNHCKIFNLRLATGKKSTGNVIRHRPVYIWKALQASVVPQWQQPHCRNILQSISLFPVHDAHSSRWLKDANT